MQVIGDAGKAEQSQAREWQAQKKKGRNTACVGKTRQRKGRQGKGGIERARQGNVGIDTAMEERVRQGEGRKGTVGKARMVGKAKARNGR